MNSHFFTHQIPLAVRQLVTIGLGALIGVIIVELFLWLVIATPLWHVLPVVGPSVTTPNLSTGEELVAGYDFVWPNENRTKVKLNDYGLRDRELRTGESAPETRVVMTGDSYIMALEVEQDEMLDDIAEGSLRDLGHDVEILNLAVSGHGPLRQLVRYEEIGADLDPDIVFFISRMSYFLTGELISDAISPGYVPGPDGELVRGGAFKQSFLRRYIGRWQSESYLALLQYSNLARAINEKRNESVSEILGIPGRQDPPLIADVCATDDLARFNELWINNVPEQHWNALELFFDEFVVSVGDVGSDPIFAIRKIPIPHESCGAEVELRRELVEVVENYLSDRGIRFVDWETELQNSETFAEIGGDDISILSGFGTKLGDGHFNLNGHEASAEILTEYILEQISIEP